MREFFMVRKKKLLILIPALLLIPILLGMVPLKMAHKLAQGGPFAQSSQGRCNNCLAHSLISHNHLDAVAANATPTGQALLYSQRVLYAVPESIFSNIHFSSSIPLRC